VRAEKDGGAENALERRDQPSILFPAFLHAECLEHLRRTLE